MKWVDLTDMLFMRAFDHLFTINKPEYRNDIVQWRCIDKDRNVVAEGKTVKITVAKSACKVYYDQLKQKHKTIRVTKSGKLRYK